MDSSSRPSAPAPAARATAEAVLETVPAAMRAVRTQMRQGRAEGVSIPQFRAMVYLWRNPGTDLSSLAEHLGASLPAVSELVSRLVRDGLAVREPDPASRRRIRLTLSPEGERQWAEARGRTLDWLSERLGSASGEELAQVESALRLLRSLLED